VISDSSYFPGREKAVLSGATFQAAGPLSRTVPETLVEWLLSLSLIFFGVLSGKMVTLSSQQTVTRGLTRNHGKARR